jgi:hypothetical protein
MAVTQASAERQAKDVVDPRLLDEEGPVGGR